MQKAWEEFLDPEILRPRLVTASFFITAYEVLKGVVVGHVQSFYQCGFDKDGPKYSADYGSGVRSKDQDLLRACLKWFEEQGAIDQDDMNTFADIRSKRNALVHEMPDFIAGRADPGHLAVFPKLLQLLQKVDKWWVLNVEIPTDPELVYRSDNS